MNESMNSNPDSMDGSPETATNSSLGNNGMDLSSDEVHRGSMML